MTCCHIVITLAQARLVFCMALDPNTICTSSQQNWVHVHTTAAQTHMVKYVYMDSWPHGNDYSQAVTQLKSTVPNEAISRLNYQNTRTIQRNLLQTHMRVEAFKALDVSCTSGGPT